MRNRRADKDHRVSRVMPFLAAGLTSHSWKLEQPTGVTGYNAVVRRLFLNIFAIALFSLVLLARSYHSDMYRWRKGMGVRSEFVGQPLSFAVGRLGQPTKSCE